MTRCLIEIPFFEVILLSLSYKGESVHNISFFVRYFTNSLIVITQNLSIYFVYNENIILI